MSPQARAPRQRPGFTALAAAAAACVWLAGCQTPPLRPAPAPDRVPAAFRGTVGPSASGASNQPVSPRWWEAFGDPLLSRVVEQALAANYDLKLAEARINEARASVELAERARTPSIPAVAEYKRQHEPSDILGGRRRVDETLMTGIDATWEIDFFGRLRKLGTAAQAGVEAQQAARGDVALTIAAEVCRNYVELRGKQQALSAARESLKATAAQIAMLERRAAAGRSSLLDSDATKRALSIQRANAADLDLAVTRAIHRLGVLTGNPPATLFEELSRPAPIPPEPAPPFLASPANLLRRRPDIRQAEQAVVASAALDDAAAADLFPRIGLNGQLSVAAYGWSIGPTLSWDIFDRRRVRARQRQASARVDEAFATYQAVVLSAFEEVENALATLVAAHERRDALSGANDASAAMLKHAQRQTELGVATQFDVVAAEKAAAESAGELAAQETAIREAWITLITALGGGWESPAPGVSSPPKPTAAGTTRVNG